MLSHLNRQSSDHTADLDWDLGDSASRVLPDLQPYQFSWQLCVSHYVYLVWLVSYF